MSKSSKDRNQHIKVFTRVRPRNSLEVRSNTVVECVNAKEVAVKDKGQTKMFAFDRVFGPDSKQVEVYKAVVGPLISEVLQGYNCTVFAYGQTGTGKTFTMVGDRSKDHIGNWENDPLCGIVPRSLDNLFDELKVRADEYTVRVSFLELYNEELFDLLAPCDNDDAKTLRLFEDSMKKGSVIVSGLEERTVNEKNDVYPILEAGTLRRQTAPTLMNAQSSRSHTIFTITVYVKVTTPEGEELFKTGKLNLVDLAGSENIGRSGAVDIRAREAGNINQSLLTLGRVITSLVERTPHIPYRESKLTRILQDSLGGRTKTSIIATVSPAQCNIEETLSTFDYAHRARHITNKPEINQKMSKSVLLKNYLNEIERLRKELAISREKHGVYLMPENYNEMISQIDNLNKDLVNKIQLLKVREDEFAKQEDILQNLNSKFTEAQKDLVMKTAVLEEQKKTQQVLEQQTLLILKTANEAIDNSKRMHDRYDKARLVYNHNQEVIEQFKAQFCKNLEKTKSATQDFLTYGTSQVEALRQASEAHNQGCRQHESAILEISKQTAHHLLSGIEHTDPVLEQTVTKLHEHQFELNFLHKKLLELQETTIQRQSAQWLALHEHVNGISEMERKTQTELTAVIPQFEEDNRALASLNSDFAECLNNEEEAVLNLERKEKQILKEINANSDEQDELLKKLKALRKQERNDKTQLTEIRESLAVARARSAAASRQFSQVYCETSHTRSQQMQQRVTQIQHLFNSIVSASATIPDSLKLIQANEETAHSDCQSIYGNVLSQTAEQNMIMADELSKEMTALIQFKYVQFATDEMLKSFESRSLKEGERLTAYESKTRCAHRQLADSLSEFCEKSFATTHDLCNELKVHLKEKLLRDDKTGKTPQRKEFNYPKRIITLSERLIDNAENIPQSEQDNVIFGGNE